MNVNLIVLEGGGDLSVKVVDDETFEWINGDDGRPEDAEHSWEDPLVPAYQAAKLKEAGQWPLELTSGSWDNDRALAAFGAKGYLDDCWGYDLIREAMRDIRSRGDVLVDEYHGCIY